MKKQLFLVCLLSTPLFLSACGNEKGKNDEIQKIAIVQGLKTAALFKTQLALIIQNIKPVMKIQQAAMIAH